MAFTPSYAAEHKEGSSPISIKVMFLPAACFTMAEETLVAKSTGVCGGLFGLTLLK